MTFFHRKKFRLQAFGTFKFHLKMSRIIQVKRGDPKSSTIQTLNPLQTRRKEEKHAEETSKKLILNYSANNQMI